MHSVTETQIRLNQYESMRLMIDWLADRVTTVIAQAVEEHAGVDREAEEPGRAARQQELPGR